jgi:hypothetical protein
MVVLVAVILVLVIGAQGTPSLLPYTILALFDVGKLVHACLASLLSVHPLTRVLLARQIPNTIPSECNTACAPINSITDVSIFPAFRFSSLLSNHPTELQTLSHVFRFLSKLIHSK